MLRRPDLRQLLHLTWYWRRGASASSVGGLVAIIQQSVRFIGAEWVSPDVVVFSCGKHVKLVEVSSEEWGHLVKEHLPLIVWPLTAGRRRNMQGIEHGIDREASQAAL